jgi:hypothetical protein
MGKKGNTAGGDSLDPTYIGLVCGLGPEDKNTAGLFANFETCAEPDINIDHLKEGSSTASISTHAAITADSWHHMLVSVKLDDMSSTGWAFDDEDIAGGDITGHFGGLSHVYMAIDDVNLLGSDLTGDYPEGYDDKNAVAASDCIEIANEIQPSEVPPGSPLGTPAEPTGPVPSYSVSSLTVPGGGNPIGLPATSEFASSILRVEMAEFQMWTGVSMDTSDETFRRAFIDADGKPVPPDRKRGDGESSGSIELMGSRPNVLFNGSGNWINGKNTGPPPDATPSGPPPVGPPPPGSFDFTPTGTIKAYKPDPSLHGPQS